MDKSENTFKPITKDMFDNIIASVKAKYPNRDVVKIYNWALDTFTVLSDEDYDAQLAIHNKEQEQILGI